MRTKNAEQIPAQESTPELRFVPLEAIDTPRQPVRRDLGDIAGLAESMHDYGLQQPISVRAVDERYMLTSGLRRLTAARTLGWSQILAFVRTATSDEAYLLDLIENLQREDLSPEEEADAFVELTRRRGWTLQQVGGAVKRSVGYVSKRVRIFEDPVLRAAIVNGRLAISTGEELLATDAEQRAALVEQAIREGWDQGRARDALRPPEDLLARLDLEPPADEAFAEESPQELERTPAKGSLGPSRPAGLTRAVREFHRLIMHVQSEDLSAADRAALRALFRDLVMLARGAGTPTPRVFPLLPEN